jgi:hypothetical protein
VRVTHTRASIILPHIACMFPRCVLLLCGERCAWLGCAGMSHARSLSGTIGLCSVLCCAVLCCSLLCSAVVSVDGVMVGCLDNKLNLTAAG